MFFTFLKNVFLNYFDSPGSNPFYSLASIFPYINTKHWAADMNENPISVELLFSELDKFTKKQHKNHINFCDRAFLKRDLRSVIDDHR